MRFAFKLPQFLPAILLLGTGCGTVPSQLAIPTPASNSLEGSAQGGRQPIAGAHIYLFAANTSSYGAPSIPLLNPSYPGVATDSIGPYTTTASDGSFSLSNAYTCSTGQQVYAFLTGGNPGLPQGSVNPSLGLLAVLGPCPNTGTLAGTVPFLSINEISTIAAAYALAGFMTDPTHISSGPSAASQRGLANAFAIVNNLINIETGVARNQNLAGNGVVPQAEINTLADILVPCVNSDGAGAGCSTLFSSVRISGDTSTIADTATAAIKLARNPALNVDTLFGLVPSAAPFQPILSTKPNDWTIGINYFTQNMVGPYFPAFDSQGNLWVPSYNTNTLVEFDPLGTPLSGSGGFAGGGLNQPYAVAVNSVDNVWAVNFGPIGASGISRFRNDGTPITSSAYNCSSTCFFPAFDTTGNLWISGATQTTVLASDGTQIGSFGTNAYNSGIVIDSNGNTWTLGHGGAVYRLTRPSSSTTFNQSVTASSGNELTPMAADSANNIWFVSNRNNAIGKLSSSGALLSPASGYSGGGLKGPAGIAVDGDGNIWVANRDGNSISAFTNGGTAITPTTGYTAQNVSGPRGLAIDLSGNVWITNFTYNSVTEFVGIAAPVSTPISPATQGKRP
jgi:streptogramin lyase